MDGLIDFRLEVPASTAPRGEIVWLQRRVAEPGFTERDRSELLRWGSAGRRGVAWENDPSTFAMLYEGSRPWASWAVARQDGALVVWDCVTFVDIGRFDCMVEALAALSGTGQIEVEVSSNVVPFAAARASARPI